jgi:hypothetical protein
MSTRPGWEEKVPVTVQVPESLVKEFQATVSAFIKRHRDGAPPAALTLVYVNEEEAHLLTRFRASYAPPPTTNPDYLEFSSDEVAGLVVVDAQGVPGVESIWVGPSKSDDGASLQPHEARALAQVLLRVAAAHEARQDQEGQ